MRWYLPDGNPLFWDEMRRRLRDWRWYRLLCCEILLLGGMLLLSAHDLPFGIGMKARNEWGESTYLLLILLQGVLIISVIPSLFAGAITRECEGNTADALWLTSLTTWSVVLGKYCASLAILLLMLLAGIPVMALLFFFGGISLCKLLLAEAMTLLGGAVLSASVLYASCRCKRTFSCDTHGICLHARHHRLLFWHVSCAFNDVQFCLFRGSIYRILTKSLFYCTPFKRRDAGEAKV